MLVRHWVLHFYSFLHHRYSWSGSHEGGHKNCSLLHTESSLLHTDFENLERGSINSSVLLPNFRPFSRQGVNKIFFTGGVPHPTPPTYCLMVVFCLPFQSLGITSLYPPPWERTTPPFGGPGWEWGGSKWTMLWRTSTGSNLTGLLVVECS